MSLRGTVVAVLSAVCTLALSSGAAPSSARPAPAPPATGKILVLDEKARALVRVDAASGQILERLTLPGPDPTDMLQSPDGRRVVIVHRIEGSWTLRYGFHPSTAVALTIVDPQSLKIVKQVALGWNWPDTFVEKKMTGYGVDLGARGPIFTPDGKRMVVVCPGYISNDPSDARPRELFVVDLETGDVAAKIALDPPVRGYTALFLQVRTRMVPNPGSLPILSRNGEFAYVLTPPSLMPSGKSIGAQLHVVDLGRAVIARVLPIDGVADELLLSPDGAYLYVLDRGVSPDDERKVAVAGKLLVFNTATATFEKSVAIGPSPAEPVFDGEGRLLAVSDDPGNPGPTATNGLLTVVKGPELVASVPVVPDPAILRFSRDGKIVAIAGRGAVVTLSLPGFQVLKTVNVTPPSRNEDRWERVITDMIVTPDGAKAVVSFAGTTKVAVLDLQEGRAVGEVLTGLSRGAKTALAILGGVLAGAGAAMNSVVQARTGNAMLQPYNSNPGAFLPGDTSTFLGMRRDGAFAYAFCAESSKITVVDLGGGKKVAEFAADLSGEYPLREAPGTSALLVAGSRGFWWIDTSRHAITRIVRNDQIRDVAIGPDGTVVIAAGDNLFYADFAKGDVTTKTQGLGRPAALLFER